MFSLLKSDRHRRFALFYRQGKPQGDKSGKISDLFTWLFFFENKRSKENLDFVFELVIDRIGQVVIGNQGIDLVPVNNFVQSLFKKLAGIGQNVN